MSFPPPPDPEIPSLDLETVGDDEQLGVAVDVVVVCDREARERATEIVRYAEALRAILDEDTWRLFLVFDERTNARFSELLLVVARWAFVEGRRHPLEPSS